MAIKEDMQGIDADQTRIDFKPFDNGSDVIKGVVFWPLIKLDDPKSQATLFVELVSGQGYHRGDGRNEGRSEGRGEGRGEARG